MQKPLVVLIISSKNLIHEMDPAARKAHKERQGRDRIYKDHNVEEQEVTLPDGTVIQVRSRLEALWLKRLAECESFVCFECTQVPVWIQGPYGQFLSNYKPDITVELADGSRVHVELKPTHQLAMADDRAKRAAELNPKMKFVVIGGYPYAGKGVTVRMITGKNEKVLKKVDPKDVLIFLGCS